MATPAILKHTKLDQRLYNKEAVDKFFNGTVGLPDYDEETRQILFTRKDGETLAVTIPPSFVLPFTLDVDEDTKELVFTFEDDTDKRVPMSELLEVKLGDGIPTQVRLGDGTLSGENAAFELKDMGSFSITNGAKLEIDKNANVRVTDSASLILGGNGGGNPTIDMSNSSKLKMQHSANVELLESAKIYMRASTSFVMDDSVGILYLSNLNSSRYPALNALADASINSNAYQIMRSGIGTVSGAIFVLAYTPDNIENPMWYRIANVSTMDLQGTSTPVTDWIPLGKQEDEWVVEDIE